jgi:hypothetical protein
MYFINQFSEPVHPGEISKSTFNKLIQELNPERFGSGQQTPGIKSFVFLVFKSAKLGNDNFFMFLR